MYLTPTHRFFIHICYLFFVGDIRRQTNEEFRSNQPVCRGRRALRSRCRRRYECTLRIDYVHDQIIYPILNWDHLKNKNKYSIGGVQDQTIYQKEWARWMTRSLSWNRNRPLQGLKLRMRSRMRMKGQHRCHYLTSIFHFSKSTHRGGFLLLGAYWP